MCAGAACSELGAGGTLAQGRRNTCSSAPCDTCQDCSKFQIPWAVSAQESRNFTKAPRLNRCRGKNALQSTFCAPTRQFSSNYISTVIRRYPSAHVKALAFANIEDNTLLALQSRTAADDEGITLSLWCTFTPHLRQDDKEGKTGNHADSSLHTLHNSTVRT